MFHAVPWKHSDQRSVVLAFPGQNHFLFRMFLILSINLFQCKRTTSKCMNPRALCPACSARFTMIHYRCERITLANPCRFPLSLPLTLSLSHSVCLSVCLSLSLSLSFSGSVCLSLSVSLSLCMSVCLSLSHALCMSVCLSRFLSLSLSLSLL